jgi:hypothetical protein
MPNTKTLICGVAFANRPSTIWVAKSTAMTGAAISTAAAKNVVTSAVITAATRPAVTWGRLVPTAWNERRKPPTMTRTAPVVKRSAVATRL